MKTKPLLYTFATIIAAIPLAVLLGSSRSPASPAAATPPPPEIPVVRAELQLQPDALAFSGRIEAIHRVELRPRVGGAIEAVHFHEGGLVQAGDVLFTLDARPYRIRQEQAAAEVERAQATLGLAEQEMARTRRLHDSGAVAVEEFERRNADLVKARASLAATRAALSAAELDLDFTIVRAPVTGRVGLAELTPGNLAQANLSVLTHLVSVEPMRVRLVIDEATLQRVLAAAGATSPGLRLTVPGSNRVFAGAVDYIGQMIDPKSGTAELRATLTGTAGLLVDGMFARVDLLLPAAGGTVLVPEAALGAEQGSRYVLVADSDHKLVQRRVVLGARLGAQRAIVSGVSAGDAIVIAGLQFLRPGMTIRPVPAAGPAPVQVASN